MGLSTTPSQPFVTAVEIDDLTSANAGLEIFRQDAMALQPAELRARRVIVRLDSAVVVYHSTNLRVRARASRYEGWLGYVTFGPQTRGTVDGFAVRPGVMVVAEPGTQTVFVAEPSYESIALLVRPQRLHEHLAARRREHEFHMPRGVEVVGTEPALARALFVLGKRLVTAAARNPAKFAEGRPEREAVEIELLEALLAAIRSTHAIEPNGTERTRWSHSRTVELAERHALSRVGERVQVSDLCRAAHVSERTLESAFKQVTGLAPIAYLTRLRLHLARAQLLAAEPGSTRVSTIATRLGFWHFGEFSRSYRRCFGELPSQTLRKDRDTRD
jgi:AraC-like DNA-binding protein